MKFPRVRDFHPSTRSEEPSQGQLVAVAPRPRGRRKGSRVESKPVQVRGKRFLGVNHTDEIPPALWNQLTSMMALLFKGILRVVKKLEPEQRGDVQCRLLFIELPQVMFGFIRQLSAWWWSYDRGFRGTTLKCPQCSQDDLKFEGDAWITIVSPFGDLTLKRSYYLCGNRECGGLRGRRYSVHPLDERLGLDGQSFLPCCHEVVAWLTALDPFGKALQLLDKLGSFFMCHHTAWRITQRVGELAKQNQDRMLQQAFGNPADPVMPRPEMASPEIGVITLDGTTGRVDKDGQDTDDDTKPGEGEDPHHPRRQAGFEENRPQKEPETAPAFREIKVAEVAHLAPPKPTKAKAAKTAPARANKKSPKHKVRPADEEPLLVNKKMAVHLDAPLLLFQMILLLVHRLGLNGARTILVLGDGAHWIWQGVDEHLAGLGVTIVKILDFYHCDEHVWKLANLLHGKGTNEAASWARGREAELLRGRLDAFFMALRTVEIHLASSTSEAIRGAEWVAAGGFARYLSLGPDPRKFTGDQIKKILAEVTYFRNNKDRIDYATYLAKGYLIGSGSIEGCCRHLIKDRIGGSGKRWSPDGVMNVLRNRTLVKSGDWERFWGQLADQRWERYRTLSAKLIPACG